jgi:cytosine/adenosine deaminase-related metal-dependent hydrolase
MLLRARIVLPVAQPPIEDGAILISANRIARVDSWLGFGADEKSQVVDLGEVVVLPGLVNAHCHLDYTGMAGLIPPQKSFTDWIRAIVGLKASWTNEDFAASWRSGAEMLLRNGTTTVADVEAMPGLLPAAWDSTPLRMISFRELISLKGGAQAEQMVQKVEQDWADLPNSERGVGLSPHAPYTTTGDLLQMAAHRSRKRKWRLMTHVSESEEEFEMFLYKHGPLYDWLRPQRDVSDCGLGSPIAHLELNDYLGENLLAVHVNYLWRNDAPVLGRHGVHVVHCPRSHDYFKHQFFPRAELTGSGVNICLGTDSLASVLKDKGKLGELDMFAEMRAFSEKHADLPPAAILKMATMNGARALGLQGQVGELSPNTLADLIAIPYAGTLAGVYKSIVHHQGEVLASMIGGTWAIAPRTP